MKLTVLNFRRIASGEYDLADDGVTLFAGPNEAGKSSVCQALASLLRGPALVPLGLQKNNASLLVHNGATEAMLTLERDQAHRSIWWPSGRCITEGPALEASEFALGLKSLCDNADNTQSGRRERAAMLASVLETEPTREDLQRAIQAEDLRFGPKVTESVWERLQAGDAGWAQAKEYGQRLKGEWQAVTRQTWGSQTGAAWLPPSWEPELAGASEDTLAAACVAARETVEALLQSSAVSEANRVRLAVTVAELPALREAAARLEQAVADCTVQVREARARAMVPRPEPPKGKPAAIGPIYTCAWTGHPERLAGGQLVRVEEQRELKIPAHDELLEWQRLQAAWHTQEDRLDRARLDLERTKAKITETEAAEMQLAAMDEPLDHSQQIEAARAAEGLAKGRLLAWQQKTRADHTHAQILTNQSVVRILSPEGLRAEVLARALAVFNAELKTLCDYAKWPAIILEHDFLPRMGGWQYRMLSQSAQFRVRAALQIAMALRERAPLTVIDGCDVLDRSGRNALFALLRKTRLPTVITMTMSNREECPDLGRMGGCSYWLGDGA